MTKSVFIFGAGSSRDEGLPLQNKLLHKYFSIRLNDQLRGDLKQYFEDFYDIDFRDIDNACFPSFEEALGILELAIQKEEIFGPNYPSEKLQKLRKYLILSMGLAIQHCEGNFKFPHDQLIRRLFRGDHFIQDEYSFISFNYDIILDKVLMKLSRKNIFVDYEIIFSNENEKFTSDAFGLWGSPLNKKKVTYLKPHGSLNWMQCPKCGSIYIKGNKKSDFFDQGYLQKIEQCKKDGCLLNWIIEPPSYFKKYNNIYIQNIWKKAFDIISQANKIIFIGYSMPEADIWFKYLLKKSCFKKKKKFIVINPSPIDESIDNTIVRYERLLGPVNYYQCNFKDFAQNHKPFLSGKKVPEIQSKLI